MFSGFARSNGFLNAVFPAARAGKRLLMAVMSLERITHRLLASIGWDAVTCIILFVPYILINWRGYLQFCVAHDNDESPFAAPEWCGAGLFPSVYSYVQLKYWNVEIGRASCRERVCQ